MLKTGEEANHDCNLAFVFCVSLIAIEWLTAPPLMHNLILLFPFYYLFIYSLSSPGIEAFSLFMGKFSFKASPFCLVLDMIDVL